MVLAAAVELLHCATLVHDDVIDDAAARRGVATVNAVGGSSTAILTGDVLIAAAYGLAITNAGCATNWVRRPKCAYVRGAVGWVASVMSCVAMVWSLMFCSWESRVMRAKAWSASMWKRSITMPLAWPMMSRLANAVLSWCSCCGSDEGDRGVGGEDQADRLGFFGERPRRRSVEVQRPEVVALDEQLEAQHGTHPRLDGGGREAGPPGFGGHVGDVHGLLLPHRAQARPVIQLGLQLIEATRGGVGGGVGLHHLPASHYEADDRLSGAGHSPHRGGGHRLQGARLTAVLALQRPGEHSHHPADIRRRGRDVPGLTGMGGLLRHRGCRRGVTHRTHSPSPPPTTGHHIGPAEHEESCTAAALAPVPVAVPTLRGA